MAWGWRFPLFFCRCQGVRFFSVAGAWCGAHAGYFFHYSSSYPGVRPASRFGQGVAAPTHDGLREALAQTGRLLLTLMSVAALLEAMPLPELLTAVHPMLHPLRYLGVDPDRGVIRLMLVLRYAETLPRSRDWRTLLDVPASSESETLQLDVPPLRRTDYLVLLMLGVSLIVVALR